MKAIRKCPIAMDDLLGFLAWIMGGCLTCLTGPQLELASASLAAGSCGSSCGTIRGHLITPLHANKHPNSRKPHQQLLYHVLEVDGDASPSKDPAASTCDNYT